MRATAVGREQPASLGPVIPNGRGNVGVLEEPSLIEQIEPVVFDFWSIEAVCDPLLDAVVTPFCLDHPHHPERSRGFKGASVSRTPTDLHDETTLAIGLSILTILNRSCLLVCRIHAGLAFLCLLGVLRWTL